MIYIAILVPSSFAFPLFDANIYENEKGRYLAIGVLGLGILFLLIIAIIEAVKFAKRSNNRKLCALKQNYTYLGHWTNTSGYFLGVGVISYVLGNYDTGDGLRISFVRFFIYS